MTSQHRIIATGLALCSLLAVATITGCKLFTNNSATPGPIADKGAPSKASTISPIDGLPADAKLLDRRSIAVMVENEIQARPQSGLNKASIVYEGITEGGISRFMAVYLQGEPKVIGPVRSTRPHFIYTSEGYDAIIAHCGQSNEAEAVFESTPGIRNLDQARGGEYDAPFYREPLNGRAKEHTLYTSMSRLRETVKKLRWESGQNGLPDFVGGEMPTTATACPSVNIKFSPSYRLSYAYDEAKGGYARSMDGKPHIDRESKEQLIVKNVIIQNVEDKRYAPSDKNDITMNVTVVGSGSGYFLTGGKMIPINWEKSERNRLTKYTDEAGNPIPLQPGQTWVELLAVSGTKVDFGGTPVASSGAKVVKATAKGKTSPVAGR